MLDRARQRAASLRFGRAALNMLAFPLFALGWLPGALARLLRITIALVVEGFVTAYRGRQG